MTARCPYCGKPIQASAGFCIHCGEPTDADSLSELEHSRASSLPPSPGDNPAKQFFSWTDVFTPGRRLEFVLGLGILLVVLAFGVYSAVQTNTQGSHYRAGMNALAAHDYDTARTELLASQGYQDADKRLKDVDATIHERDQLYTSALKASSQGKWWAAGNLLKQVNSIQANYKDVPQLLQKATDINGIVIYRLARQVDGQGSIYVAQADGSDTRPIPHTDAQSQVHALSSDGRWVIYSTYKPDIRTYYLYDVVARYARLIALPTTAEPTVITARFTTDNAKMWIVVDKRNYVIDVPAGFGDGPVMPNAPSGPAAADQVHAPQIIVRKGPSQGSTTVGVADFDGHNEHTLVTEAGSVDGAVFSKDRHFMLYRACAPDGTNGVSLTCVLHLLNMTSPFPNSIIVGTITLSASEQAGQWSLNGEFTRDGGHLNVITSKGQKGWLDVYKLNDADGNAAITRLGQWTHTDSAWDLTAAPFIWTGVPGLKFWKGPNSQAYTTQTVILPEGTEEWAARAFGKSHWVSVSPGGKYAVYLVGRDIIASAGDYRLCATSLAVAPGTPEAASRVVLLHTIRRPSEWLPFTYILPDGQTLLSTMPPNSTSAPGLYSYDLATGEATNDIPDVTDIWFPGFASLIPDIPVFTWHNE